MSSSCQEYGKNNSSHNTDAYNETAHNRGVSSYGGLSRLLMGLQSTPSGVPPLDPVPSSFAGLDLFSDDLIFDLEVLDDKSLYEEITKSGVFQMEEEMVRCMESVEDPSFALPGVEQESMRNWKARIEETCSRVNIPKEPQNWSVEDVKKWCLDTLQQLRLPCLHPLELKDLELDGTKLCMLSSDDFKTRAPGVGQSLYAELVNWRNVICLSSLFEKCNFGQAPVDSVSTYLDLDTAGLHRYQASSLAEGMTSSLAEGITSSLDEGMTSSDSLQDSAENSDVSYIYSAYFSHPEHMTGTRNPLMSETSSGIPTSRTFSSSSHSDCRLQSDYSFAPMNRNHVPVDYKKWMSQEKRSTHLWQFLKELLSQPSQYQHCIRWTDHSSGIFKIEDSGKVAKLWGERKHRPAMNYDKLSRSIRQYYKKGIIRKAAQSKRLVYQFCPQYL